MVKSIIQLTLVTNGEPALVNLTNMTACYEDCIDRSRGTFGTKIYFGLIDGDDYIAVKESVAAIHALMVA